MPGKWKKGEPSPNPSGRPPGIVDKRMRLTYLLNDDADSIVKQVIEKAKSGDLQAAKLVLDRVSPPLRNRSQTVSFELDVTGSFTNQARQIFKAIATGELDPDTGKLLVDSITAVARISELDEINRRLEALESVNQIA